MSPNPGSGPADPPAPPREGGAPATSLPGGPPPEESGIEVRPLRTHEELGACVALQKQVWGEHFSELVPAAILSVSQRVGGIAAGAFDPSGVLLGFVFGITGPNPAGRLVHWSDMLAVRPGSRNLGMGRRLKEYQREVLESRGVEEILWTFDPLVARNAHLNLMRLGAQVVEYVPDMYGSTGSPLHRGMGTDRFIVSWLIGAARRPRPQHPRIQGELPPLVNPEAAGPPGTVDLSAACSGAPLLRVQIPADIEAIQRSSPEGAGDWRLNTRAALVPLLEMGYRITGVFPHPESRDFFYLLEPSTPPAGPPPPL